MIPIIEEHFEVESCVYKLYHGNKYVIVKGKTLTGSVHLIEKGYQAFMTAGGGTGRGQGGQGQNEWDGVNTYYLKLYKYIYDNPKLISRIEILNESNSGYELLKTEHIELQKSIKDKNCINNNVQAYIPKYRKSTNSYGWISKAHVLNFQKFLKAS